MIKLSIFTSLFGDRRRIYFLFFQIISAVLSLLFGKLVALYVSPEQFGTFNLQYATYFFTFSLIIQPYLQFIKFKTHHLEKELGYSLPLTIFVTLFLLGGIINFLVFYFILKVPLHIYIASMVYMFFHALYFLMNDYFSIKNKLETVSWISLLKGFLMLFGLIAVVYLNMINTSNQVEILWGVNIIGFAFVLYFFFKDYPFYFKVYSKVIASKFRKDVYKYCMPLFVLAFWGWLNTYSDRYIIEHYLGLDQLGIYNANLGVGSKFFLMINPIFLTLMTSSIFSLENSIQAKKQIINKYLQLYLLLIIAVCIVTYFLFPSVGRLLLSDAYSQGFFMIFWTACAYGLITWGYLIELYFYASSETRVILYGNIIAALVYIIITIVVIRYLELLGIGIALCIASFIKFIFLYWKLRKAV